MAESLKMSRSTLVQATHQLRADLTGRLATLQAWIAEQERVRISDLIARCLKQGLVSGRRPDNHVQWDVRQLVKMGAAKVVAERRTVSTERILGFELRGQRFGLYIPPGHIAPTVTGDDSFRLVDERGQFKARGARERARIERYARGS